MRIYWVINWCEYDGYFDFIVISCDEDCDDVLGDEVVWVICWLDNKIYIDRILNENDYYFFVEE